MTALMLSGRHLLNARRINWALVILSLLVGMVTRQWLVRNTLVNPPSYDALVYQNQSYDDLQLLEQKGFVGYLKKYMSGIWHVPPLYTTLGTGCYLFLGLAPANAYLVNACFFFVFFWSAYLLFRYAKAGRFFSVFGALIVGLTPSTAGYALRHYMTDYAAAAAYLLATGLLLQTRGLRNNRKVVQYSLALGCSLLLKTSLLLYYLPHALILIAWVFSGKKERSYRQKWLNLLRFTLIGLLMTSWFYVPNLKQILNYYLSWAGSRSVITTSVAGISSTSDNLLYYFRNIALFHYQGVGERWIWGTLSIVLALALLNRLWNKSGLRSPRCGYLLLLLAGQYLVLTAYPSKVFVVDYSLVPFYFLVPVAYLFDHNKPGVVCKVIFAMVFLSLGSRVLVRSVNVMLKAAPVEERQDWKVKGTLEEILRDAEKTGYNEVVIGSTSIHPYFTCENMRFLTLNGTFPEWRNGFKMPRIGYAKDAEELYSFVKSCDYVVTVDGWQGPDQAPNNHLAPQVNEWLAQQRGGFELFLNEPIPHNSRVKVYKRHEHLTLGQIEADGWVQKGFSVVLQTRQPRVKIRLEGRIPLPSRVSYPAHLHLAGPQQELLSGTITIPDSRSFSHDFEVTMRPEWQGVVRMELVGDHTYSPREQGVSDDARQLLVILNRMTVED